MPRTKIKGKSIQKKCETKKYQQLVIKFKIKCIVIISKEQSLEKRHNKYKILSEHLCCVCVYIYTHTRAIRS